MSDFDFTNLGALIKSKAAEIERRTNTGIHDDLNFKKFRTNLYTYKDMHPLTGFVSVLIDREHIKLLIDNCTENLFESINQCIATAHNHLIVDHTCSIISTELKHFDSSQKAKSIYLELSKKWCVFVIKKVDIHYFVDGDDVGEIIFFTKEEEARYKERKSVTQLSEIFDQYRIKLSQRDSYSKFFVSNSSKKALLKLLITDGKALTETDPKKQKKVEERFLLDNKQLLENKPEDRFREDLRKYLDDQLKATVEVTREHLLENLKRIDILITDEYGDLYLIEVKWVGTSVHSGGGEIGITFKDSDINPDAIVQTIDYLWQLQQQNKYIKMGYLVVFDARDANLPDTVATFEIAKLKPQSATFYSRFMKIKDFRVINQHPN